MVKFISYDSETGWAWYEYNGTPVNIYVPDFESEQALKDHIIAQANDMDTVPKPKFIPGAQ